MHVGHPLQFWGLSFWRIFGCGGLRSGAWSSSLPCWWFLGIKKMEMALGAVASKPVESHVHGFCVPGLYVVVCDSKGCAVVSLHGSQGLFVAHFC